MKKKISIVAIALVIIALILSISIDVEVPPKKDSRVILEHTYHSYIAPTCFEESDATNFLEESTLDKAMELNYAPHSACTEEALKPQYKSFLRSIFS